MSTSTAFVRAYDPKASQHLPEEDLEEQIRQRAYQIWLQNGSPADSEMPDWLEAEKEILEGRL